MSGGTENPRRIVMLENGSVADVLFDGRNYGGKELIYCKSDYVASLQFAGRQEREFGWTFSFALTLGKCR